MTLLASGAAALCGARAGGAAGPLRARVDASVARAMADLPIRAVSVTVARDGVPVVAAGYGLADPRTGRRADASTDYPIGSITKTFTAAAILALRDQGRLDLDAPIARYVPDAPHGDAITVRMLLAHRSGLPDVIGDFPWEVRMQHATAEQMVASVGGQALRFAPGSQFAYANTNYLVLGLAVERVTRMPLERALRRLVIEPAGLSRTGFVGPNVPNVAVGYQRQTDPQGAPIDLPYGARMYWGAGALTSNAIDLARWDGALLQGRIIRRSSVDEMMRAWPGADGPQSYAMGWYVDDFHGRRRVRHGGNVPGFSCSNDVLPDDGRSVSVLSNLSRIPIELLADRILLAVVGLSDPGGPIF